MTPVGQITRVSHPVFSAEKLLVFIAYFDDSGHTINSPVLTVGGVIAKASAWESFEEKWSKRLRREKVSVFHMTDYESRQGEFTGWDERKRITFISDLAAILKNTITLGVGASVIMQDWLLVMPQNFLEEKMVRRRGPYPLMLQICLEKIAQEITQPASERIACVFDENHFARGAILDHYHDWKEEQQMDQVFGSMTFDNVRRAIPLQAADMVAYEAYKDVMNGIVASTSRPERRLHQNLWKCGRICSYVLDREGMQNYVDSIRGRESQSLEEKP